VHLLLFLQISDVGNLDSFHDTDGSQPLEQILHLCHQLILRGIAYLHVAQSRFTRNLDVKQNVQRLIAKGIALEDISLQPFRRLLSTVRPTNPLSTQTILIGNGGYNAVSGFLAVEAGLADAVSFGRGFISNPDLVERLRLGNPLTPNNVATFYTHGAQGYTSYTSYPTEQESDLQKPLVSDQVSENAASSPLICAQAKKRVAIIGAGVSGLASAAALERVGGFNVRIFERRGVPGGSWVFDPTSTTNLQFSAADFTSVNSPLLTPATSFPATVPLAGAKGFHTTPLYSSLRANIPYKVMGEGSVFELLPPQDPSSPFLSGVEISAAVAKKAHQFNHLVEYYTTVEDVEKLSAGRLRLTLRKGNPNDTDTWTEEEFDHLIVASGHNSVPRVPHIPGLDLWTRNLRHTVTWRSGEEFRDQVS
jgi:Pyridine nucleotide-disulphide oxidoreductase